MPNTATGASKYKQQLLALDAKRKKMAALMKKAEEAEKKNKFINAGKDLFEHFKVDPHCKDNSKIAAICMKYFSMTEKPVEGKEDATGMDIASKTKK